MSSITPLAKITLSGQAMLAELRTDGVIQAGPEQLPPNSKRATPHRYDISLPTADGLYTPHARISAVLGEAPRDMERFMDDFIATMPDAEVTRYV